MALPLPWRGRMGKRTAGHHGPPSGDGVLFPNTKLLDEDSIFGNILLLQIFE
jgi:hypothetical protein